MTRADPQRKPDSPSEGAAKAASHAPLAPDAGATRTPAHEWLLALTQIPTAAGHEQRVVRWVRQWVSQRPDLALSMDEAGNLLIAPRQRWGAHNDTGTPAADRPIYITAHLDHPAFVVERLVSPGAVEIAFRGGVMDVFFQGAPITLYTADDRPLSATIVEAINASHPVAKTYLAELDEDDAAEALAIGDIGVWTLPPARIDDGPTHLLHTNACDDLAAVAAALAAFERLREMNAARQRTEDVRLLFTRAEEIGFVGAIAACKHGSIAPGARVVALENSRSFADSPIGGGPIVRVGDRISIFSPVLTAAIAKRAEELTGAPAQPKATESKPQAGPRMPRWQRKLMAGGACEASVYCAYGHEATCLCLPLGNYHNMPHLAELQAGTYDAAALGPPRCAPEYISIDDFDGLVELLVAVGTNLPSADPFLARAESIYKERAFVLEPREPGL